MAKYTFSADGTQPAGVINAKEFSVAVSGTFGSGTLNVQYSKGDNTFQNYAGGDTGAFTSADERVFAQCGEAKEIALTLSGSTSPDLTVIIQELR